MMTCNFKLYEIANHYLRALDNLVNDESHNDADFQAIKDNFDNKCIATAKYIKNLEAEYQAVKDAIENMNARAKSISEAMESLSEYLKSNIETTGLLDPIKCDEFEIKLANNPPSVVIVDAELIPDIYKLTKEVITVDKMALKKDIESGFDVEGAVIERKKRLIIK